MEDHGLWNDVQDIVLRGKTASIRITENEKKKKNYRKCMVILALLFQGNRKKKLTKQNISTIC